MDLTVAELFAGVGGFRVGLNKIREFDDNGKAIENGMWKFVCANQNATRKPIYLPCGQ